MPKIPRVGPGEVVQLRPVRPDDVGGGAGQAALSDAAQNLGALSARMIDAERDADVARAEVGYSAELAEFAQTVDQNPDVDAREAQFEEGRKAIGEKFRQGIRGQQYQAAFDQRAFQHGERAKLVVREGVIRKRLDNARGGVIESVDKFDRLIEHSESDQLTKGYVFARSNILDAGVASGAISAAERAQIEESSRKALEQVELRKGSQQRADAIVAGGGSITEQLKAAREIEDPQMQDLVVARVKDRAQEADAVRNQAQQAQRDELFRRAYLPSTDPARLSREELVSMRNVEASTRSSLMRLLDASAANSGKGPKTDPATYYQLKELMLDPRRREEAQSYNLYQDAGKLSIAKLEQLQKWQRGEDLYDAQPVQAKLNQYKALLYHKRSPTPAEERNALLYEERVENRLERERVAKGRQVLSDDELDAVFKSELRNVAVPAKWWGTNVVPAYQVTVPRDAASRLRAGLASLGIPDPTEDEILEAYLDELEGEE